MPLAGHDKKVQIPAACRVSRGMSTFAVINSFTQRRLPLSPLPGGTMLFLCAPPVSGSCTERLRLYRSYDHMSFASHLLSPAPDTKTSVALLRANGTASSARFDYCPMELREPLPALSPLAFCHSLSRPSYHAHRHENVMRSTVMIANALIVTGGSHHITLRPPACDWDIIVLHWDATVCRETLTLLLGTS